MSGIFKKLKGNKSIAGALADKMGKGGSKAVTGIDPYAKQGKAPQSGGGGVYEGFGRRRGGGGRGLGGVRSLLA
jgi:hypothetical protein